MPWSSDETESWVRQRISELKPTTALDVGAGAGKYGRMIREIRPACDIEAVEIWEPYIERYKLDQVYNTIHVSDLCAFEYPRAYSLTIFGDVLEHVEPRYALQAWQQARRFSDWVILCIPIVHWEQGALAGNRHETHLAHYSDDVVRECFNGIAASEVGEHVAAYIAEGYMSC